MELASDVDGGRLLSGHDFLFLNDTHTPFQFFFFKLSSLASSTGYHNTEPNQTLQSRYYEYET